MTSTPILNLRATIHDNVITMNVYESNSTIDQKDQISISKVDIQSFCEEIVRLLNKGNQHGGKAFGLGAELKKVGQLLYDQLLTDGAKRKLKSSNIENLLLHIDEGLVSIPWELLFDGKQFLCLRFNVGRRVSTSQDLRDSGQRPLEHPIKMLILADPTNDLKSARREASVIEKQLDDFRKVIEVGKKVTNIDVIYVKKNLRDFDIVHYAGHTDYNSFDPSQSGWKLLESRLTAADIKGMGNSSSQLPYLIFSNSCQSAQTKEWISADFENQVFGLANAFLCAGVRHYIGTSWKIPDDISLFFAKEFYTQIAESKSIGDSVRLARLKIIADLGEDSIVWASYILYGDPTIALIEKKTSAQFALQKIQLATYLIIILSILLGSVYFFSYRVPTTPKVSIDDFVIPSTQKKDLSLTFAVIDQLKNISSADFLAVQQGFDNAYINKGVVRNIHVEVERGDGLINLAIRILDPRTNKIISVKEVSVQDGANSTKEIAQLILDLTKVGLSKNMALELSREPGESMEVHRLLAESWDLYLKEDFDGSLRLCKKIEKLDPQNMSLYKRLGNIYDRLGKREKALDVYSKYAELSRKKNDLKNLSNAYTNMGWMFQSLKDNELALSYFSRALQIAQLGGYSFETAKGYSVLGGWYAQKKEFEKAKELFQKSIEINEKYVPDENHRKYLAANYKQMGFIFDEQGDYSSAMKYLNLSLNLCNSLGDKEQILEVKKRIERVSDKQQITEKF